MSMFCYQCEQTAKGTGCTAHGVCGKDPETSVLQDLLVYQMLGISQYAHRARALGVKMPEVDRYLLEALFTTVTNVNFDPEAISAQLTRGAELFVKIRKQYDVACDARHEQPETLSGPAFFNLAQSLDERIRQGEEIRDRRETMRERYGVDVIGLQDLILYGLKGTAAYADHAYVLGVEDDAVYAFFAEALDFLSREPLDVGELVAMAMRVGETNLRVMEMLDQANTSTYGHPVPTKVNTAPVVGKCILVSGHDLKDLEELLKQTAGTGINIYTHGEMLPTHAYPELKKYPHLVGNYGGAWQDQQKEFDRFPGAILMTTNCIQKPKTSYQGRIFTSGLVRWPGVTHIANRDFTPVIEAAQEASGFTVTESPREITVGFGHHAVLSVADAVIDAVKKGKIRRFFLIGGCDGAKSGRNYYTDLAMAVPNDCVILTLACGKYRFNKLEFGDIGGIPRLLDIGQCNDAYSAIQIALALANAFSCSVNELPLSIVLSWYEQKAVCILLTLLYLGIKNIRIGPSLPAFVGPEVLNTLVAQFGIKPIGSVEDDLKQMLG
jgi:hydroxylamine reductase